MTLSGAADEKYKKDYIFGDKESGSYSVVASNIGDTVENARVTLTRVKCNKAETLSEFVGSIAAENSTALIKLGIELADDEVLVAELRADGIADRTFYRNGALTLVPAEAVTMTHNAAARTVTVSADSYVHAVELEKALLSGRFEDVWSCMLPVLLYSIAATVCAVTCFLWQMKKQ